jgi:hypothetical protein
MPFWKLSEGRKPERRSGTFFFARIGTTNNTPLLLNLSHSLRSRIFFFLRKIVLVKVKEHAGHKPLPTILSPHTSLNVLKDDAHVV